MALHLNDHEVDGLIATLRYLKEVSSHIHSEENNIDNDEEIYKYHHERNAPMTTEPIYDEHGDLPTGHITLQPSSSGDAIWFDVVSYGHDMEDRYYRMPRDTVTLHLPHDSAEALISELRKIIDAE